MKTIGLLGGMSWQSTALYYEAINRIVAEALGGLHSAKIIMCSVDFHDIANLTDRNDWEQAGALLATEARALKAAGADLVVLCSNTMHKIADMVERDGGLPLLHILDASVETMRAAEVSVVGLLGTRYVMEQDFYRGRLECDHDMGVRIPGEADRAFLHTIIYEELARGVMNPTTEARCRRIVAGLAETGAEAVLLACTELPLVISAEDSPIPVFSTTTIHAEAAARAALTQQTTATPA